MELRIFGCSCEILAKFCGIIDATVLDFLKTSRGYLSGFCETNFAESYTFKANSLKKPMVKLVKKNDKVKLV